MKGSLKQRKISIFLMILVWVILPLFGVEIALRTFMPMRYTSILDAFEYDETLGFCVKKGFHVNVTDHRQEIYVNDLKTVNFQDNFNNYEKIIFTLGDSYTQGTGNPMDCSYPLQLDFALNKDKNGIYHKKYAVVNLGLAAFGAKQSLLAMERYVKLIGKPSVVLYFGCDNDVLDDALFDRGYKHRSFVDNSPYWRWLVKPVQWVDSLQTFRYTKYIIMKIISKNALADAKKNRSPAVSAAEAQWPVIKKIHQECQAQGAKLMLTWVYDKDSYYWLKAKAKEEGIDFIDWYPVVENIRKSLVNLPVENDHSGAHYRSWVNRVIADEFAEHIIFATKEGK